MILPSIVPIPLYKALIFDCDGTLADTLPVNFQTWSAALQATGADISEDWYYQYCGTSAKKMLQILKDSFGYQFDSESVIAKRQKHYQSLVNTVTEVRAVAEIVRSHHGKMPMAVASGGERIVLEATLNNISLRKYFDVVVSIDDVERGKPEPDIFLLASERLGVAPQDCIVYEDSDEGLEAARRAGMRSIDVRILLHPPV
jgi:HAD superfamily hydrolase (TIGR01509 family)